MRWCTAKSRAVRTTALWSLLCLQALFPAHTVGAESIGPTALYYAKLYIQTTDGVITDSKLEMLPAGSGFHTEKFNRFLVTGEATYSTNTDRLTEAKHNAISKILMEYGLKSIQGKRMLFNTMPRDITVLNYEGVVKIPCRILGEKAASDEPVYRVRMEVWFAPIAFPSEWAFLHFKTVLKNRFHGLMDFFK
jgi:hypothetical protein